MTFENPLFLLALTLVPILIFFSLRSRGPSIRFSSLGMAERIPASWAVAGRYVLLALRSLTVVLVVVALARPERGRRETLLRTEGIDIVLCLDTSMSMYAMDFELDGKREDRLSVVKAVARDFIRGRPDDQIGIVVYGPRAYTLSPLTLYHDWVLAQLERTTIGMVERGTATAIGSAIHTALRRLEQSKARSKVIILLTDGRNNAGRISPETAAEAARALGVKIYAIGAGTKGLAPYPVKDPFGNVRLVPQEVDIDDERLTRVAEATGGKYFRATDTGGLMKIYEEIDRMEKTKLEAPRYLEYRDLYPYFLIPGLAVFLMEITLVNTRLRRVP